MQEHVSIHPILVKPDPLRLTHRTLIEDMVRAVVLQPQADALTVVDAALPADLPEAERQALRTLILESCAACTKACWRVRVWGTASARRAAGAGAQLLIAASAFCISARGIFHHYLKVKPVWAGFGG